MIEILQNNSIRYLENQKQTYKRYFWDEIDTKEKLIGIVGARGVGKTTFILQYLQSLSLPFSKKLYLSADDIDVADMTLLDIAKEFSKFGGEVLAIDEIHKYKNFEKELKNIYDMLDILVIFSGSSALQLEHSKADLSRRAMMYQVGGLSYREFLEMTLETKLPRYSLEEILNNHIEIAFELKKTFKPLEYWNEYLQNGFYPFYFQNKNSYKIKLAQTINTVIEVDIPAIFPIKYENIVNLKKFIKLICQSKPFTLNIKELSSKVGVDRVTLYLFMVYLHRAKIIQLFRNKSKGDNIFLKPEKIYLGNTNLSFCYCNTQEIGTTRETFFANQLAQKQSVEIASKGDFVIDGKYTIEIGGKNKDFSQIKDLPNSFVVSDDIEIGFGNKIPLWLFGFLY